MTLSFGCKQDLDIVPVDSTSELTFWETEEDARIFLNSMYADLMSADSYLFLNALSDDAYTKGREDYRNIANGNYGSANGVVSQAWSSRYEAIRRANIFFNNIDEVEEISDAQRQSYKAQARFLRAWQYFYLIELFRDVPLITNEISIKESLTLERDDRSKVLDFIYDELALAIDNLPEDYPAAEQGRVTRDAAIAFKARVHLYNQEYEAAATLAGELIGKHELFPDYDALFDTENEYADEILLSLQYVPTDREHNLQYSLIPPSMGGYANFSPASGTGQQLSNAKRPAHR